MKRILVLVLFLSVLFLANSCRKTIDPSDTDGISFLLRLPSIAQARFEARCVSEDIFLDQVKIQSPSSSYITEEFEHQRYAKDEPFLFGNGAAEDGLWLITFVGSSAITNKEFRLTVPYEMLITADENDE
jgi:hypothetical protein